MGHLFQVEWLERYPRGCPLGLLWLRKLANEMVKDFEKKNGIFGTFYENNGN